MIDKTFPLAEKFVSNALTLVQQLEKLQTKLTNQADLKAVEEAIQAMIEANASLQERIGNEEQAGSLFGWLFKFFNR